MDYFPWLTLFEFWFFHLLFIGSSTPIGLHRATCYWQLVFHQIGKFLLHHFPVSTSERNAVLKVPSNCDAFVHFSSFEAMLTFHFAVYLFALCPYKFHMLRIVVFVTLFKCCPSTTLTCLRNTPLLRKIYCLDCLTELDIFPYYFGRSTVMVPYVPLRYLGGSGVDFVDYASVSVVELEPKSNKQ